MEDFSNFVAFSEYSNFNSAVEIEPDFANCCQWLHNFIEEQQIQIYLFFFQFEQCVGNQKTNYDKKQTLLSPKIQQTKMLVTCQRFGDLFLFGLIWKYSSIHETYNIYIICFVIGTES